MTGPTDGSDYYARMGIAVGTALTTIADPAIPMAHRMAARHALILIRRAIDNALDQLDQLDAEHDGEW